MRPDRKNTQRGRRGAPISAAEGRVLLRIAQGMENQEIADDLCLSVETVRTHVKNIHKALGACNRAHAVAIAYHVGIFATKRQAEQNRSSAA